MDFLNDEELFELHYQDELDAMEEIESANNFSVENSTEFGTPKKGNGEMENEKVPVSTKRKLSFSTDEPNLAELNHQTESESLVASNDRFDGSTIPSVSVSTKRKLSFSSDEPNLAELNHQTENESLVTSNDGFDGSTIPSAKRKCISQEDTLENFLRERMGTQARSSLFNETRSFVKDQFTVTSYDGRRLYFDLNDEDPSDSIPSFCQRRNSLLSTPIDVLKTQFLLLEEEKMLKLAETESLHINSSAPVDVVIETNTENSLWVEKYKPVSYINLLSEEGINRTLLQWLKLWDKIVFGKEKKIKQKKEDPNKKVQNPKFPKKFGELIQDLDEHGRPHHKVAFLCGPPGLGKTTLATIIAKHAGYNVVELNASDDRSPEIFRSCLEAATQMKSVNREDDRPNCLILDEIDGAPATSINVLISFIKSPGYTKGKRRKGDIPLLMRPVICICNDPYSAALKPLRQLSLILNFPPTSTSHLVSRLNEIVTKEGLAADAAALTLLCEKASNDIRSCLSTLQFIKRLKKYLKVHDVEGMTIGHKDMQKSLFAVWQDIFCYSENPSFHKILNTIQAFGDYEKVYVGMFENYVNQKFKFRNANSVWEGAEWLCFGDIIQQHINQYQQYILLPYLPYPAVAFHLLFSSKAFPHISYPSAFYEHRAKSFQFSNTLASVIKDMVSTLKMFLNPSMLLLDIFPFLLEIIKPNLRPVNIQLYSEREKNELRRVIELMLVFHLNYRQERLQDGTYSYVLDPNIEELIRFSGIKFSKPLTYSAKQMIAREVEVEQMRKGESSVEKVEVQKIKPPTEEIKPLKNNISNKPVLDFFGRVVVEDPNKKKAKTGVHNQEVWFHFKEGYSNAVRRPVYIKDLL